MAKIEFIALGGQDEKNKSCCALVINDEIFILNCGIHCLPKTSLGIKKIIPDFNFLIENKHKIKGIFIGHSSYNNFGGLEFIINKLPNVPIYTDKLGTLIINTYFNFNVFKHDQNEVNRFNELRIITLNPLQCNKIGSIDVFLFRTNTNLINSCGFIFKTNYGSIIFLDQYIIPTSYNLTFDDLITEINKITNNNNLLLITSVGRNIDQKCFTSPNYSTTNFFNDIIVDTNGRIIVALEDDDLYRLVVLANICKKKSMPMFIYSKRIMTIFNNLSKNQIIKFNMPMMIRKDDIKNSQRCVIVLISNKNDLINKIKTIIANNDQALNIQENDSFVYAIANENGYEKIEANIFDELNRHKLSNIYKLPKTIINFCQSQEDHRFIINILKPKYIIPIGGLWMHLNKYRLLSKVSYKKGLDVLILENGQSALFDNGKYIKTNKFLKLFENYINVNGKSSDSFHNLDECHKMSTNGCVLINAIIDTKKCIITDSNYDVVGVVDQTDEKNKLVLDEIKNSLNENLIKLISGDGSSQQHHLTKSLQETFKKQVAKAYDKKFGKQPLILLTIIYRD